MRFALAVLALLLAGSPARAQLLDGTIRTELRDAAAARAAEIRGNLRVRRGGVLGLFGYNVVPDGAANALSITRGSGFSTDGSTALTLGQLGFGYSISDSFPLYLENYLGYARYDPRIYIAGAPQEQRLPVKWNNVAITLGVGWGFQLTEYITLTPILNGAAGYAASDLSLANSFVNWRTGRESAALNSQNINVRGLGGSLLLGYADFRPERDIEVQLRYTQIQLESFGSTPRGIGGSSNARTLGLWGRYRAPLGIEAFGRPVRWVSDNSASIYLGDQREALGFAWSVKVGAGIEFDVGRHEASAFGLTLTRVRLMGYYFYGDGGITGTSIGIGMSF